MVRDDGVVEVWYGELADKKPQIDLVTDAVARTAASRPYTRRQAAVRLRQERPDVGRREATPEVELRPYMSAQLKKVVRPGGVGMRGPPGPARRRHRLLPVDRNAPSAGSGAVAVCASYTGRVVSTDWKSDLGSADTG